MTKKDQQLIWEAFTTKETPRMDPREGQHGGEGDNVLGKVFDQSFDGEEDSVDDLLVDIVQSPEFEQFSDDIKTRAYKLLR